MKPEKNLSASGKMEVLESKPMEFGQLFAEVSRLWPREVVLEIVPSTDGRYSVLGLLDLEDSIGIDDSNVLMVCLNKAIMGVIHNAARSIVKISPADIRVAEVQRKFEDDLRWHKEVGFEYLSEENGLLIEKYLGSKSDAA